MSESKSPGPIAAPFRYQSAAALFLVSFIALFLELALIRWIPGCIKIVGYYTNLVLISSFLGLGLGCADPRPRGEARGIFMAASFRLMLSLVLYTLIHYLGLLPLPSFWGERVWSYGKIGLVPSLLVPEIVFILNTWTFLPLGRGLGKALKKFSPLAGYSLNLAGSLGGVFAFVGLSVAGLPPLGWFALAGLFLGVWAALQEPAGRRGLGALAFWLVSLVAVFLPGRHDLWSPYYKIGLDPLTKLMVKMGWSPEISRDLGLLALSVNDDYFQFAINLDPVVLEAACRDNRWMRDKLGNLSEYIQLPYRLRPPGRVLILGTGLGNDVAAALRNRATSVTAVEIDPVIAELGRTRHPERPYQDPRVALHVTDARRFFRTASGPYDVIVYAFLDSHTLFSALASVRLDTFVYTRESFEEASRLLAPDGVMVVMFAASRDFVARRLFGLMHSRFPDATRVWAWQLGLWGNECDSIAAGPGLAQYSAAAGVPFQDVTAEYLSGPVPEVPTDDWPFLYLSRRNLTFGYAFTLAAILLLAVLFTRRVLPGFRGLSPHFVLLGAGFLLLETKSITELSLLFGSTWMVNVAVISAFLLMALLANLYAARGPLPREGWLYLLLIAALALGWAVPIRRLLFSEPLASAAAGSLLVAFPVFFSGLIFARSMQKQLDPALALGSNILGAMAGGVLEYASMLTGFKALVIFAALLYLAAYAFRRS